MGEVLARPEYLEGDWGRDVLAADVAFTLSPIGQLRREDREIAYAHEIASLQARITRAIAALDAAPDPASDEASKREAHAIQAANLIARTILAEGTEPAQKRGG